MRVTPSQYETHKKHQKTHQVVAFSWTTFPTLILYVLLFFWYYFCCISCFFLGGEVLIISVRCFLVAFKKIILASRMVWTTQMWIPPVCTLNRRRSGRSMRLSQPSLMATSLWPRPLATSMVSMRPAMSAWNPWFCTTHRSTSRTHDFCEKELTNLFEWVVC